MVVDSRSASRYRYDSLPARRRAPRLPFSVGTLPLTVRGDRIPVELELSPLNRLCGRFI